MLALGGDGDCERKPNQAVGVGIGEVGFVLIGLIFVVQILGISSVRQYFDRLFYFGAALILTVALCRTFRVMELKEAV